MARHDGWHSTKEVIAELRNLLLQLRERSMDRMSFQPVDSKWLVSCHLAGASGVISFTSKSTPAAKAWHSKRIYGSHLSVRGFTPITCLGDADDEGLAV